MAEQFEDVGRGVTLCYEEFGQRNDPPMLLIMGLATQMIGWPDEFCQRLADRGFRVVRFDNRDCGRSTHMTGRPPTPMELVRRRIPAGSYTLSDMAQDAVELMKRLEMEPAHVVGVSMGGMIAQTLAAEHPQSIRSLTSIMSTTGSRWKGQPAFSVYRFLLRQAPNDRQGYSDYLLALFNVIGSPGFPRDEARLKDVAERMFDRAHDPSAPGRQLGAIIASGDRTAALRRIRTPTLVIHGTKDRMIRKSGGRATARAIPDAELVMIEGMGHDLPEGAWPRLLDLISAHALAVQPQRLPDTAVQ
jgi:pimeloyl-ACP methyl ester carboxylesterase